MRRGRALAVGLLVLGGSGAARAQPVQCWLSTTPLVFGAVDVLRGAPATSTARVEVACSTLSAVPVPVQVRLRVLGGTATGEARRLGHSAAPLYRLYADPGRVLPVGDGALDTMLTASGAAGRMAPFRHVFTLYGTIPAGQRHLPAGAYQDVLSLLLEY
jgi:spore coat protein U-like protein